MTDGVLFWFVAFFLGALLFFGIALVVTFRGISDLRDLLRVSKMNDTGQ